MHKHALIPSESARAFLVAKAAVTHSIEGQPVEEAYVEASLSWTDFGDKAACPNITKQFSPAWRQDRKYVIAAATATAPGTSLVRGSNATRGRGHKHSSVLWHWNV